MGLRIDYTISCDLLRCEAKLEFSEQGELMGAEDLSAFLEDKGWSFDEDDDTYVCPDCRKEMER